MGSRLSTENYPGIRFHTRKTPEGRWELLATEEEEPDLFAYDMIGLDECKEWDALAEAIFPDAELQVQTEQGRHFLDRDGNEYFPAGTGIVPLPAETGGFRKRRTGFLST